MPMEVNQPPRRSALAVSGLRIRRAQLEAFAVALREDFIMRAIGQLRARRPTQTAGRDDAALGNHARRAARWGRGYGLRSERDLLRFIELTVTHGFDWAERSPRRWMHDCLVDRRVSSPTARLERLLARLVDSATATAAMATGATPAGGAETQRAAAEPVMSCPRPLGRIVVTLVDDADRPRVDGALVLGDGRGRVLRVLSDDDGRATFDGLDDGVYELWLDRCDGSRWELVDTTPLADGASAGPPASWQSDAVAPPPERDHIVGAGECLVSIADRYGFGPAALLAYPPNAALARAPRDPNVLQPVRDHVVLPTLSPRRVPARPGHTYRLRVRRTTARFRLRLLDSAARPYANRGYTLWLRGADGASERRRGRTRDDGSLEEPIPPRAREGLLRLDDDPARRLLRLRFGRLNPHDSVSGVKARLNNLGFACGLENEELDAATRRALSRFQAREGLPQTGAPDDATRARLLRRHDER